MGHPMGTPWLKKQQQIPFGNDNKKSKDNS
jgi:hypothetical protein